VVVRSGAVVALDPAPHHDAVDLPPGAVLGGAFVDHHLHLLAAAAARCSVDLQHARSVTEACALLADAARATAAGQWLRAWGIDETDLAEGRLPTADELDRAVGGRPVVVHHRTGHARLGNRAAELAGPPPPLPFDELHRAATGLGRELAAAGIVAVTDATHTNDAAAIELLDRLELPQAITAMVGADTLDRLRPGFGERQGTVVIGPAKIMPPSCGLDRVATLIEQAHRAGFPAAVHAVDIDELQAALDGGIGPGDRIEHLGLCLPEQLDELAGRGVIVVTQPAFVTRREAKYRSRLSEVEQGWLYRLAGVMAAGLTVLGSSDAPVVPPRPLEAVAAAITRRIAPSERIDVDSALAMVSRPLAVGDPADLVVLAEDPRRVSATAPERVADIQVLALWRAGRLVHGDPRRWPTLA